jgi:hypothetical protein
MNFSANFVRPALGGPGIAEIDITSTLNAIAAVGIQINGSDTDIFVVAFPTDITLNQPIDLNPNLNTGAALAVETDPTTSTYDYYGTNPAYGGSGTLTITQEDRTKNVVSRTFSGTLGSSTGGRR